MSLRLPTGSKNKMQNTKPFMTMKNKQTWKMVIQLLVSILTAIATTLGVTSCMGYHPTL